MTIEEQATVLLMKKCGTLKEGKQADDNDHKNFREQFVDPPNARVVADFRETFRLTER